jgi:hypothetical protein
MEIKFRAWDKDNKVMFFPYQLQFLKTGISVRNRQMNLINCELLQYTGLKDRNGKEIYESSEINSKYRVIFITPSYVLQDISNGDIIPLEVNNEYEVTREYSPISQDT